MGHDESAGPPKLQRIGKRARRVEQRFASLSESVRTEEVFLALADLAGIDEERARDRWAAFLALLPKR